jgi:hypothetical protein
VAQFPAFPAHQAGRRRDGVRPRLQAGPRGNRVEARLKPLSQRDEPQLAEVLEPRVRTSVRDHAHTLSDFLVPTLSIECEPCGRRGRYNVAGLMEQYGDAKLPELRHILANCPKARSQSIHDRCKVRYGEDSRPGPAVMIEPPRDDSPRNQARRRPRR